MTSPEREGLGRWVGLGALLWAAFAALYVASHAMVVDETALSAQILNGIVDYPAGHPHEVFHRQAFSLPNQLSALLLRASDSLDLVSRLRNLLVVFLSGFGPFLVATLLTRRPLVGFAASALVLSDALYRFQGVYPTFVFPTFYSHGHVGAWLAVISVACTAGGLARTGGFMMGLLPAVHPLLGALVWLWGMLGLAAEGGRRVARRSAPFFLLGLIATGASFWVSRAAASSHEEPVELYAPHDEAGAGELVRSHFLEFTDPHRHFPPAESGLFLFGYAGNTAAFLGLGLLLFVVTSTARSRGSVLGVLGFVVLAWGIVWGARALELVGGALPDPLLTAMPYRLSNVSAMLLVPIAVAAFVAAGERAGSRTLLVATIILSLLVLAGGATTYLASVDEDAGRLRIAAGLGLLGAALAAGVVASRSRPAAACCAVGAIALGGVFLIQRQKSGFQGAELFGAAFAVTAVALLLSRSNGPDRDPGAGRIPAGALLALGSLATIGVSVRGENAEPSSLVSAFDEEVVRWLDENAQRHEPLLPPLIPRTQLQVKTGHPVLLELGTLWLMPYLPDLSSVIGRMTRDLYGVDYASRDVLERLAPDGYLGQHDAEWKDVWRRRRREQWRALGQKYGFRIVVAPTDWEIDLVPEIVSVEWTLYRVPGVQ